MNYETHCSSWTASVLHTFNGGSLQSSQIQWWAPTVLWAYKSEHESHDAHIHFAKLVWIRTFLAEWESPVRSTIWTLKFKVQIPRRPFSSSWKGNMTAMKWCKLHSSFPNKFWTSDRLIPCRKKFRFSEHHADAWWQMHADARWAGRVQWHWYTT